MPRSLPPPPVTAAAVLTDRGQDSSTTFHRSLHTAERRPAGEEAGEAEEVEEGVGEEEDQRDVLILLLMLALSLVPAITLPAEHHHHVARLRLQVRAPHQHCRVKAQNQHHPRRAVASPHAAPQEVKYGVAAGVEDEDKDEVEVAAV